MVQSSDISANSARSLIKNQIKDSARGFLDRWDNLEIVTEDQDNGYFVRSEMLNGVPVIVTKCRAYGLTKEMVDLMAMETQTVVEKMNDKMTLTKLDDDEDGNNQYHFYIETPTFFISDRSLFVTYYKEKDEESGCVTITSGSPGNDDLAEKHTELAGSTVVANLSISYQKFEPFEGGYNIEQVSCFDANGWIPGGVQQLGVTRTGELVRHTVDYLINGTIPQPVF